MTTPASSGPPPLVIEYVLDGKRPGYTFAQPANGTSESLLKAIWRQAMPRGQGWGADTYQGARALKGFAVDGNQIALSDVVVTEQQDEGGRRGIRRAEIRLMPAQDALSALRSRLAAYPAAVREAAHRKLTLGAWTRVLDRALPKVGSKNPQIILTYPYTGPNSWQVIEAIVLQLVTSWPLRAVPGWGHLPSFTTLALTHQDEARIVALPVEKAKQTPDAAVIEIG
jgi:hypothetical protein